MNVKILITASGAAITLLANVAHAVGISTFDTSFSANQSLFQGGPSAGFNESGSTGGTVGISYRAVANTGTVNASVNGQIQATYTSQLSTPNTPTTVGLQFNGGSSSFSSQLGANANISGFVNLGCVIPTPFGCAARVNETFSLLDEGLFLNPNSSFNANIGASSSASDADSAIGFGPNLDLIIGELGAEVNLDIDQAIGFNPLGLNGILSYQNRNTGEMFATSFLMGATDQVDVVTESLTAGIWDFSLLNLELSNSFSNDVDLEIRPTINYVLGEWPAPGSSPLSFGLIDESFELDFNTLTTQDLFSVQVVPVPAAVWLFGSGLLGLIGVARRKTHRV
jgi:hypothetical protein